MFTKIKKKIELMRDADIYKKLYDSTYDRLFCNEQAMLSMQADGSLTGEQIREIIRRSKELYKEVHKD